MRRILRWIGWFAVAAYFIVGLAVLGIRHFVLPVVNDYRLDIERNLSESLGQPVTIRMLDARWRGLRPRLQIHGLEIRDAEGRVALGLDEVQADIAWSSLWHLAPHFARLEIDAPRLDLRRTPDGRYFVAGMAIKTDDTSGEGFATWLLAQDRIVIRDATVTWQDELRQAQPLVLAHVELDLRNRGDRHRFGLVAEPPRELATRLDVRGDFRGEDLAEVETWKGEAYTELDYADLAAWRQWIDYPIELPRGNGGLRLWLDFDRQALTGATADVRLRNTALRLAPNLPMLELADLSGRIGGRRLEDGFVFHTRHLDLATRGGIRIDAADTDLRWHPASDSRAASGEASANALDLGALSALAAYFPLADGARDALAAYEPGGRVRDARATWTGTQDALAAYSVKARFEDLSLKAHGRVPGFAGIDGRIEADQHGGLLELATRAGALELPAVFEQPTLPLAVLDATLDWNVSDSGLDVRLISAKFQNDDAAGEASGRYLNKGSGPGEIDLAAKLTRASGGAVWRYMPLVVGADVRAWLHESLEGGAATATLRLKGDLDRFPFKDGSGTFEVKGSFQGVNLRYAADWPAIQDVTGDLLFAGPRMLIQARQAKTWDVQLADVSAEIGDLGATDVLLAINGGAHGPTADFLRFIDASPVSGYIDHVTDDMKGSGGGQLHLRLDLPLGHLSDTRVDGRYRFVANALTYDADLPPITDINGELHFTDERVEAKKIRAVTLGAPMTLDVATEDGRVKLRANGSMSVAALRQHYGWPVFDDLAGSAPWLCTIDAKKRAADIRFESSLLGVSSSLPDPFNKTAGDALPLVFERKPAAEPAASRDKGRRPAAVVPANRDQTDVTLGSAVRAQLLRRRGDGAATIEQGLVAVNRPDARLPDSGILVAVQSKRLDLDYWRRLAGKTGAGGLPVSQFDVRADELRIFGRSMHALELTGRMEATDWKMDIKSQEAIGKVEWTNRNGADRFSARLARLDIADTGGSAAQLSAEPTEHLPAVDLAVDQFLLHGRDMGQLKVNAENAAGVWSAQFHIRNDDGSADGTGRWQLAQAAAPASTGIDFTLKVANIEGMLGRLGYPEAVRRGSADLVGTLAWTGAPTAIDYPSLSGKLKLEASQGQFKRLDPGVGRLLGILSLQSLPRRVSLDFRDIFSEGFAFDSIDGKVGVNRGIMDTSDFVISGPAAKVLMNGTIDLVHESQDLKVRVQPTLGETVATGALLVNPVVGATAWLMNKVFGNPLDKVFAFDYSVTGSWVNPKVERVAVQGPGIPRLPGDVNSP
ncbi:MAG TPA: YhdP family protein [Rhodocyclaceae bacterium]|nr:YhdP family protein [Rhodocyclaceae bacterium]